MLKKLMNMKKKKGFTLIELIVVLVIMAILAAAAIPTMMGYVDKARASQHLAEGRSVYVAATAAATEAYGKFGAVPTTVIDASAANNGNETDATGLIQKTVKDMCTNGLPTGWTAKITCTAAGQVTNIEYHSGAASTDHYKVVLAFAQDGTENTATAEKVNKT